MHLRDRIKKKTTTDNKKFGNYSVSTPILVLRSDSTSAEVIHPPSSPVDDTSSHGKFWDNSSEKRTKRLLVKAKSFCLPKTLKTSAQEEEESLQKGSYGLTRHRDNNRASGKKCGEKNK